VGVAYNGIGACGPPHPAPPPQGGREKRSGSPVISLISPQVSGATISAILRLTMPGDAQSASG